MLRFSGFAAFTTQATTPQQTDVSTFSLGLMQLFKSMILKINILIVLIIGFTTTNLIAQIDHKFDIVENDTIFYTAEKFARYPDGELEIMKFISKNLKITKEMNVYENECWSTIYIRFIINKQGKVRNPHIIRSGDCKLLNEECLRVVKNLKDFQPASTNGKTINVWYTMPIRINFQ